MILIVEGVYPDVPEIAKHGPKISLLSLESIPPAPVLAGLSRSERCIVRKPC